jgi:hypothetical protein
LLKTNDDFSHNPPKQASTFLEKYSQLPHNLSPDERRAGKKKIADALIQTG